jgi:hypothetical protein
VRGRGVAASPLHDSAPTCAPPPAVAGLDRSTSPSLSLGSLAAFLYSSNPSSSLVLKLSAFVAIDHGDELVRSHASMLDVLGS